MKVSMKESKGEASEEVGEDQVDGRRGLRVGKEIGK
jgi:hypothetical protein